jgi:hypothetical protein
MKTNEPIIIFQKAAELTCLSYKEDVPLMAQIDDWKAGTIPNYQNRLFGSDKLVRPLIKVINKNEIFYLETTINDKCMQQLPF